jgi:3-hydroxyisobutyrate dehydrogenase
MKVAFIGMGTMGSSMALNLLRAGHDVTVHNRTREKELPLLEAGARRAESPQEAAAGSETIITCVSDGSDVEAVVLGEKGVIYGAAPGSILIDMSTISPQTTRRIGSILQTKGIRMLDAPVSGGSEGAKQGTLSIMVGGIQEDLEQVLPVLQSMGKTITHVGTLGSGQLTKAINQIIIAGTYWGVAEGMTLGLKAGLDMNQVIQAVSGGAAASWCLSNRSQNMIQDQYPLGFRLRFHQKDLKIALETARELGVPLPLSAFVEQMETALIAAGDGDEDISVLARGLQRQANIFSRE